MAKTTYKDWEAEEKILLLQGWARNGLTNEQIASNMEIAVSTLWEWRKKSPKISNALKIGKEVELLTKNGMKLSGILKSADSEKFVVTITKKVKSETSKRKVEVEEDLAFGYDEVKYTKYLIRFK